MTNEGGNRDQLINDAIDESIEFEELMDKTDFDSWIDGFIFSLDKDFTQQLNDLNVDGKLRNAFEIKGYPFSSNEVVITKNEKYWEIEDKYKKYKVENIVTQLNIYLHDTQKTLEYFKQGVDPFREYEKKRNDLTGICRKMVNQGTDKIPDGKSKSQIEKYLIKQLFLSKFKRLEARISSDEKRETEKYDAALFHLFSATNALNKLKIEEAKSEKEEDNKWLIPWSILFLNDLSICYAGLENSSLSRGYAKEARKLIEDDNDDCGYSDFKSMIADTNNNTITCNHKFVASKRYDLYTIALYNQAEAERRSNRKSESEKNFKEIIKFAERLENFNYYSALLNLSVLYIEEGRGNEAIQLLNKIITPEDLNKIITPEDLNKEGNYSPTTKLLLIKLYIVHPNVYKYNVSIGEGTNDEYTYP